MKIYVASTLSNSETVKYAIDRLQNDGHTITYDWTSHGIIHNKEDRIQAAVGEYRGVVDCDILLVIMPGGRGTHFEFGLKCGLDGGCQNVVFVYGADTTDMPTSFHDIPGLYKVETVDSAIKYINELSRTKQDK